MYIIKDLSLSLFLSLSLSLSLSLRLQSPCLIAKQSDFSWLFTLSRVFRESFIEHHDMYLIPRMFLDSMLCYPFPVTMQWHNRIISQRAFPEQRDLFRPGVSRVVAQYPFETL